MKTQTGRAWIDREGIMEGNVASPTQFSWYIAGRLSVKNGHITNLTGGQRQYALDCFKDYRIPQSIHAIIMRETEDSDCGSRCCLYCIRRNYGGERMVYGWILTVQDGDDAHKHKLASVVVENSGYSCAIYTLAQTLLESNREFAIRMADRVVCPACNGKKQQEYCSWCYDSGKVSPQENLRYKTIATLQKKMLNGQTF